MRINRKRRAVQTRGGLTEAQREWLLVGGFILADPRNGRPFASEAEELAAWNEHRDELMAEARHNRAGSRPHAFFKFDLKVTPRRGHDELAILLEHRLIDVDEARLIERFDMTLAPEQSPGLYSAFDSHELIERRGFDRYTLESVAGEFELATKWHAWRGRSEISELYRARAEAVRGVMVGMNKNREVVQ